VLLQSEKKKMDERDQKRQLIGAQTEGTGRLRGGVERVRAGLDQARGHVDGQGAREAVEDAGWFLRRRVVWPVEDGLDRLGRRGAIGVFGGGGVAVVGVVAALVIAGSAGSGSNAGDTEAFITPQRSPSPAPATVTSTPKPKAQAKATKPTGPTLHGAPPDFYPAKDVRSGVADGTAVGGKQSDSATGGVPASRAARNGGKAMAGGAAGGDAVTSGNDSPASTAKIGATPGATASAQAQASKAATASGAGTAAGGRGTTGTGNSAGAGTTGGESGGKSGADEEALSGPPAPKAAKRVARRFTEAFVVYEIGDTDAKVREAFGQTSTKQLSRSLLRRPPRQPASVKVPRAKVVNVVAGPSKGSIYTVSVSLLRVGVTSELRLEMEQGVGKKWQVTNVLG
jgi:hypothetical protein